MNDNQTRFAVFIVFIVAAIVFCSVAPVAARRKSNRKQIIVKPKNAATKARSGKAKKSVNKSFVISGCLMNGRATKLAQPIFPPAARAVRAYGIVSVQVLIDENGGVIEAKAVSGHPLLRAASIAAARESKFAPVFLSGKAVKVSGVIVYNFVPQSFNWLEVGYILQSENYDEFYNIKNLLQSFPDELADEQRLLQNYKQTDDANDSTRATVIALIESKLNDKPRESWLFELGRELAQANASKNDENASRESAQALRVRQQTAPETINRRLLEDLQKLVSRLENQPPAEYNPTADATANQLLQNLLERMPFLGR